jgi:hypothetical protein
MLDSALPLGVATKREPFTGVPLAPTLTVLWVPPTSIKATFVPFRQRSVRESHNSLVRPPPRP